MIVDNFVFILNIIVATMRHVTLWIRTIILTRKQREQSFIKGVLSMEDGLDFTMDYYDGLKTMRPVNNSSKLKLLEIGGGVGRLFANYPDNCQCYALNCNRLLEPYFRQNISKYPTLEFMDYIVGDVEDMYHIGDNSMDAVIWCSVLCSANSPTKALKEVMRVLKPGGHIYFSEHCLYPDDSVKHLVLQYFQRSMNGMQRVIGNGCQLTRKSWVDIERSGFRDLTIIHVVRDDPRAVLFNSWIFGHGVKPQ
ncbi:unnamed protein product [Oppiella nova]|uniref:Methyltransferase type 11 domain-containing protein n=1 Tax=Oppiella nova TaxID=334625 RepID=A0A7R9ME48_9ACAR|nr:unnamed protein product [Oppiella nova]CAG2174496.1 unnamed protein product [Oppiella nova]